MSLPGTRSPSRSALLLALALGIFAILAVGMLRRCFLDGQVLSACGTFVRLGPFSKPMREHCPPGTFVWTDSMTQFEPWRELFARRLATDGSIPLWKDNAFCGAPFLANYQSALLYPLHLVAAWLGNPPATGTWLAFLHLVLGAAGAFLLLRHLRCGVVASLAGGAVFGFSAFAVIHLAHPHVRVLCTLPWLILALDRLILQTTARRAAAVAAVAAWQHLAGHPETALHVQLVALGLAIARACTLAADGASARTRRATAARRVIVGLAALALGLAGAAIQIVPFLEYLAESDALRQRVKPDRFGPFAIGLPDGIFAVATIAALAAFHGLRREIRPARAIVLCVVLAVGVLAAVRSAAAEGMEFQPIVLLAPDYLGAPNEWRGPWNYWTECGVYSGPLLAAAILGALASSRRGLATTGIALAVLGVLFGARAPLLSELVEQLPVFAVSVNRKFGFLVPAGTALLTALAVDALPDLRRCRSLRARYAGAFLAIVVPVVLAIRPYEPWVPGAEGVPQDSSVSREGRRPLTAFASGSVRLPELDSGGSPTGRLRPLSLTGWFASAGPPSTCVIELRTGERISTPFLEVSPELRTADPRMEAAAADGESLFAFRTEVSPWIGVDDEMPVFRVLAFDGSSGARHSRWISPDDREESPPYRAIDDRYWPVSKRGLDQLYLLAGAFLATFALVRARGIAPALLVALWAALSLLSLWPMAWTIVATVPKEFHFPQDPDIDALRKLRPQGRFLGTADETMPAEVAAYYGLADPRGYDALAPWRTERLLRAALDHPEGWNTSHTLPSRFDIDLRLLGACAVGVVTGQEDHVATSTAAGIGGVLFRTPDRFVARFNPHVLARARLVANAIVRPADEDQLATLRAADFPIADSVVLASGESRENAARYPGHVTIRVDAGDRVVLEADVRAPCHLVLADTWFPGWRARVDGEEREILRANFAFRAVALEPGDRTIEFEYEPASFRVGAIVTAIAGLLVLALIFRRSGVPPLSGTEGERRHAASTEDRDAPP